MCKNTYLGQDPNAHGGIYKKKYYTPKKLARDFFPGLIMQFRTH